jgi:hypothetical protein
MEVCHSLMVADTIKSRIATGHGLRKTLYLRFLLVYYLLLVVFLCDMELIRQLHNLNHRK